MKKLFVIAVLLAIATTYMPTDNSMAYAYGANQSLSDSGSYSTDYYGSNGSYLGTSYSNW